MDGSFQVDGNNSVVVEDGLTLNGTATLGDSTGFGLLYFEGTQTLGGSGTVVFGTFDTRNALMVASAGTTLTIGAGITVQGQNGYVGYDPNFGGSPDVSVVNQGTIAADTSGGTITVYGTGNLQNVGILQALNGGTLSLQGGNWQDSGVNYADATSVFSIGASFSNTGNTLALTGPGTFASSGTIQGGTVSVAAGTLLDLSGTVDGVTVNGSFQVDGNNSVVVEDGLTLNGTADAGRQHRLRLAVLRGQPDAGRQRHCCLRHVRHANTLLVSECGHDADDRAGDHCPGPERLRGLQTPTSAGRPTSAVVNQGTIASRHRAAAPSPFTAQAESFRIPEPSTPASAQSASPPAATAP